MLLFSRDEAKKPELLSELSKKIPVVEEVDFDLMLAIVQSCQDLQTQPQQLQEQQLGRQQNSGEELVVGKVWEWSSCCL